MEIEVEDPKPTLCAVCGREVSDSDHTVVRGDAVCLRCYSDLEATNPRPRLVPGEWK